MLDPLVNFPGYLLRRASAASFAVLTTRLALIGLRPTEASILTLIAYNPHATQSDIGSHLGVHRANMAPIVARLEEQGWLVRQPIDGRSQGLALTAEGAVAQKQAWSEMQSHEARLSARIPPEHRDHVLPILNALSGRL